uniref:Uncharacterized protein n=1 Tax=Anopheles maculatus TaxID=74869 RepID=A0A182SUH5_9DIPT
SNVSQQSQPIGNQILTPHANSNLIAGNQQEHQRHNNQHQSQQHLHEQQLQLNGTQQRQESPAIGKRIKLSEQNLHSMVVLPASVKLCDTWKFDDLLQLNGTVTNNAKGTAQHGTTVPQANIIASFVTTATKKSAGSATVNGNNKRTLNGVSETAGDTGTGNNCKRLKSSAATTPSSAPQLLQQLMAPSPVPQKLKSKSRSSQDGTAGGRWPNAGNNGGLLQEQSGNSVLMNLLVSGCDVSAGYSCFPRPSKAAKA